MSTPRIDVGKYMDDGYIILRGAFSSSRMRSLVDAVNHLIDRGLAGEVNLAWINKEKRLPDRTSHLLAPDKYEPAFADWLAEDLAPQIEGLLQGPARLSLFGMLAGGAGRAYPQAWHRDLGKPGAPDEVAYMSRFNGKFVQFNAPLLPGDKFLHIVPGSHRRASTSQEIKASKGEAEMPGALEVQLEPGDIAYYDANLWHRGWNPAGQARWTMHSAFWKPEFPVMQHEAGQREGFLKPGHLERMPATTRQYIERYIAAYPSGTPVPVFDL